MRGIAQRVVVMWCLSFGCACTPASFAVVTTSGAKHGNAGPEFPSRASLNALAQQPVASAAGEEPQTLAVDEWQPDASPTDVAVTEAEALVKAVVDARLGSIELDSQLTCAAGQVARFYAAHAALPDQQLQAHIAGVCGATQPALALMVWATPSATVAQTSQHRQWYEAIQKQLGDSVPTEARELGGAEYADGKTNVFAAAVARSEVDWEASRPVVSADGTVDFSGSVRGASGGSLQGFSNIGDHGVRSCRSDLRVAAPRFHVTCELDPSDTSAWVDLEWLPPGRVLAKSVARVLARREGASLAFSLPGKNAAARLVRDSETFRAQLFSLVNERRAAAGLPALKLASRESETSAGLVPHYFDRQVDADTNDKIALGLLAGWDVDGTIKTGDFYSAMLAGSLDPRRWLTFVLEQPAARRVLLAPEARALALGLLIRAETQSVGVLISTYDFYDSEDHRADVARFVAKLNEERRRLGLPPAQLGDAPEVSQGVEEIKSTHDPDGALQKAMQGVMNRVQHGVEGFCIEATSFERVTLPEALLRPNVTIAVSATHHRHPKAAWGTLSLLVVVLDSAAPARTARAPRQHRNHGSVLATL